MHCLHAKCAEAVNVGNIQHPVCFRQHCAYVQAREIEIKYDMIMKGAYEYSQVKNEGLEDMRLLSVTVQVVPTSVHVGCYT